jgi:peptidoglycan/xylan/chitin deacetylase (PgdA/CDA1 family)
LPILCYHAVEPGWRSPLAIHPDLFARHCAWLSRHRRTISLPDGVTRMNGSTRWPAGLTALSFDDGFAGLHKHALPILLQHRLPATVFLVAQTLTSAGRPVDWVDDPPDYRLATLSRDQVLEMQAAGITFGSHSYSHLDLTTLTEEECERDLRVSREVLEDLLGGPVRMLAYPRGRHNERVRAAAARAGFTQAFALPQGPEPIGPHAIPRVGVWSNDGLIALRAKTSNWYFSVQTSPVFPIVRTARHVLSRKRSR